MFHVREVISYLNHDDLVVNGVIPSLIEGVPKVSKRFPLWVYRNKSFSFFGMMMDFLVRRMLSVKVPAKYNTEPVSKVMETDMENYSSYVESLTRYLDSSLKWIDVIWDAYRLTEVMMGQTDVYTREEVFKFIPTLQNIFKDLHHKWSEYSSYLGSNLSYNVELVHSNLQGHPDVVTDTAILDIKTTGDYSKMAIETSLQILTYYALARINKLEVKYVGVILPLQREILLYDVSAWDPKDYLDILSRRMGYLTIPMILQVNPEKMETIGTHVAREESMLITLKNYISCWRSNRPVQMFLRSRGKSDISLTEEDIIASGELIKNHQIAYYTHAPYIINLCCVPIQKNPTNFQWIRTLLRQELRLTRRLHGRGVVVHTGTRNISNEITLTEEQAYNEMESAVRDVLEEATEECPLLLETPVGEGKEICATLEGLASFYARFSEEERKRLRICCDTAHVWGAGYWPLDYLMRWSQIFGTTSIALIHLNDSEVKFSSHVDRHAPIGKGQIGFPHMYQVIEWASSHNIPLVVE